MNYKIYTMFILAILVVGFSASGCFDEQSRYVGTYEVKDKVGNIFHITLNADETATITGVGGINDLYYCSWYYNSTYNHISIGFSDKRPTLFFEGGLDTPYSLCLSLSEDWLYKDYDNMKSKNPGWRLKVNKIRK